MDVEYRRHELQGTSAPVLQKKVIDIKKQYKVFSYLAFRDGMIYPHIRNFGI